MSERLSSYTQEPIDRIIVANRLRNRCDEGTVQRLMDSIQKIGLQTPISVRPDNDDLLHLVAGRHRLEAVKRLGMETIDCVRMAGTNDEARMWEIAENLHRADLTVLERDEHIAEWIALASLSKPTPTDGDVQFSQVAKNESKREDGRGHRQEGGVNAAARELGIDKDAAYRATKVAGLSADAKEEARRVGLDNNQSALLKAAKEPEEAQAAKVREIADAKRNPEPPQPPSNPTTEPHNHRAQGTGQNEWYTPAIYVAAAKAALGEIDLDPASSAIANETVGAANFYTINDDGLNQLWRGRVWMNPPYAQPYIADFIAKLVAEVQAKRVTEAIALTHNYTDTAWFHNAAGSASAICFTRGRISFLSPTGEKAAPTQGQAFFYFGADPSIFIREFGKFGLIVRPDA